MSRFEAAITRIATLFWCAMGENKLRWPGRSAVKFGRDEIVEAVKFNTSLSFMLLSASAVFVALSVFSLFFDKDNFWYGFDTGLKVVFWAVVVVIVFGVSQISDRIFHQNCSQIEHSATKIIGDPSRGRSWARIKLLRGFAILFLAFFTILALLRLASINGTGEAFFCLGCSQ